MIKLNNLIAILGVTFFCVSCSVSVMSETEKENADNNVFIKCKEPRPEICTREYNPVCATKNTGIVCITTPCPSTEEKTYSTGCTACADPTVIKYTQGQCE
jgi:hypothetical protein